MNKTKINNYGSGSELLDLLLSEKKKLISKKVILDKKDNKSYPLVDIPFNIPSNWTWCYLSDVSLIQEGPGIRKHQYQDEGVQFLTVTNILEDSVDLEKSKKFISEEQYVKIYSHFTVNKGDIVTACSGGSWGKSAMYELNDKIILNTSTLRLRFFNDRGNNKYLYYLTKTNYFKDSLSSYNTGQQPNYGYFHYSKIPIPLPPLPEQQRIVAILDEAFVSIAKAKAIAERNLKNSKELFESYKNDLFLNKGKGYEERELLGICDKITQGPNPKYDKDGDDKFRVLKTKNLYDNNIFYDESDRVSESVFNSCLSSELKNGDVLLAIVGQGSINKCNVFENKTPFRYIYTRALGLIRVKKTVLDPYYLKAYLQSNRGKKHIDSGIGGTSGQQVVTTTFIKAMKIPLPSLKEQQIIIQKLDALSSETKKLETIYQQKLNDLEELKKSVLQKAFNGELKTT